MTKRRVGEFRRFIIIVAPLIKVAAVHPFGTGTNPCRVITPAIFLGSGGVPGTASAAI
jgi:hypothetical protein